MPYQDIAIVVADQNLTPITYIKDYLLLGASRRLNQPGAMTVNLPLTYQETLDDSGVLLNLQTAVEGMPCSWMWVLCRIKGYQNYFVLGDALYLITRPGRKSNSDGEQFITLNGVGQVSLLDKRGIPRKDEDPLTIKSGNTATVMHDIFTQEFGPAGTTVNGVAEPRRDWITSGEVADGASVGGPGQAGFEPKLNTVNKILGTMTEAAQYSTTKGTPIFFDMVPDFTTVARAEKPSLPFTFTTYAERRGVDRSLGNAGGNPAVILSEQSGTISDIDYGIDLAEDYSVSYGFGAGTGPSRPSAGPTINNARANSCRWGFVESITTDNEREDAAAVQTLADSHLEDGQSRGKIVAKIQQTEGYRFGDAAFGGDYDLGDSITLADKRRQKGEEAPDIFTANVWISGYNLQVKDKESSIEVLFELIDP